MNRKTIKSSEFKMPMITEILLISRLFRYVTSQVPMLMVSAFLRIVNQGTGMALLVIGAWHIGSFIIGKEISFLYLFVLMGSLGIVKACARYGEQVIGHSVAFTILARMRTDAYVQLERLAPAFPERERSGELVNQLTSDVDRIEVFYAHTIGPFISFLFVGSVAIVGISFIGGPHYGVILGIGLFLVGLVIPLILYLMTKKWGMQNREIRASMTAFIAEHLRGAPDVFSLGIEDHCVTALDTMSTQLITTQTIQARYSGVKDGFVDSIIGATLLWVAFSLHQEGIPLPSAFATIMFVATAFAPALGLGRAFDDIPETAAASKRFFELLERRPYISYSQKTGGHFSRKALDVSINHITFAYPGYPPVLNNLSLHVPGGSHCVILGPSGSGKSTLLKLIARFYDPQDGDIYIDQKLLRSLDSETLRSSVLFLSQNPFVFDRTVAENVRFFVPYSTDDSILAVLERLRFSDTNPEILAKRCGPRGTALSGGERRRLALSRLLLSSASILLLDESFSNLDAETRVKVRRIFLENAKGCTIIEVSHDETDAQDADLVISFPITGEK